MNEAKYTAVKITTVKIGDRVVKFDYWNTAPECTGRVVAFTEHFVEIEKEARTMFGNKREWVSRDKLEVVLTPDSKPVTEEV